MADEYEGASPVSKGNSDYEGASPVLDGGKIPPKKTSFLGDVASNFAGGIRSAGQAAKDIYRGDFIGADKSAPATGALADKLFSSGQGGTLSENIGDVLYNARENTVSSDYSKALLERSGQNVPGEIANAIGGIVPEFNAVGSAIQKYVNPKISKATGIAPENLQLAELASSPLGFKKAGDASLPISKAILSAVKPVIAGAKQAATHPLDTAGKVLATASEVPGKVLKPVVQPIAREMIESDNPVYGGGLKTALKSDAAKEGERLGKKLGVKFSAGELTGNAAAMNAEDALANSAKWGAKFAEANQKKTDAIVSDYKKTLDSIYPKSVSRLDIGDKISSTYGQTIKSLSKARSDQGKMDFAAAKLASQGQPIIAPTNLVSTLKSFVKEGESITATKSQEAAAATAKALLAKLKTPSPKPSLILDAQGNPIKMPQSAESYQHMTIDDLQNGLQGWGDEAYTGGGVFKQLANASDTRFAKAAKAALERDADTAAESGQGAAAIALKRARDNYRANSNKISDIEKTTLGKMIGSAERDSQGNLTITPEKMADKFNSMQPSEIKNILKFLDKNDPNVAGMARRYTLESALNKALEGQGQRGAGGTKPFPKAEFVKSLPSDDKLEAIMGSAKAAQDVKDVAAALTRMIDYGAQKKGSATAQRTDFLQGMLKWGKGALYRSIASDSLAEDLLDPTRRKELVDEAKKNIK